MKQSCPIHGSDFQTPGGISKSLQAGYGFKPRLRPAQVPQETAGAYSCLCLTPRSGVRASCLGV